MICQKKKRASKEARFPELDFNYYLIGKIPGSISVRCGRTGCNCEGPSPSAFRMVGAICAVCTGAVMVAAGIFGFDTRIITLVSSCEKPPCSACFEVLPEYVNPTFGVMTMS